MTNPYHAALDEHLRGERVRVVSNDGQTFEGWVERVHHHDRHVLLRDAHLVRDDGSRVERGAVMAAHADSIEVLDPASRIEEIVLSAIEPSPFHQAEFDVNDNREYIAQVRRDGWVRSYPTVRPIDGDLDHPGDKGFQVVEGHKRIWAARQAGLRFHPVEIVDIGDWQAAMSFVYDRLPGPHNGGSGWYDDQEAEAAVDDLLDEFGEDVLEVERIAWTADRLEHDGADREDEQDAGRSERVDEQQSASEEGGHGDDGTSSEVSPEDVLEELAALHEEGTAWAKSAKIADRLDTNSHRVGQLLGKLRRDDRVERHNDNATPAVWRIVPEGEDGEIEEPRHGTELVDILEEKGEVTGPRLKELADLDETLVYENLGLLKEEGVVESRRDPDDGRRKLYSLQEHDDNKIGEAQDSVSDGQDAGEGAADTDVDDELEPPNADEEGEGTVSQSCHCGATFDDSLEEEVHRTEAHDQPQRHLGNLRAGEFEDIVNDAESVEDLVQAVGISTEKILRMLNVYGLEDVVGPGDVEISDLNDWEFDGIVDEADASDESESFEELNTERAETTTDGGTAALAGGGADVTDPQRTCQNCGAHVSKEYARVNTPENEEGNGPRVCPQCPDKIRDKTAPGGVREARSPRRNRGGE